MTFIWRAYVLVVVGLYQSIHFYQAAMERQTRAAQLETQLFHRTNLRTLEPVIRTFCSTVFTHWNPDAGKRRCCEPSADLLGDLLRTALEAAGERDHLAERLEFVGKYLEIEQTRFHDRLKVHVTCT